jgi:NADP-dependent 3-hydroxy acid dehydrogenase YdfG
MDLNHRVAVVTGAASGIGAACGLAIPCNVAAESVRGQVQI